MPKTLIFITYLIISMIASGVFGMIHDQISYTVSNEYFTKFKFLQFHLLDAAMHERIRAAQVGWFASWWMGIPLGIFSGTIAFIHPTKNMIKPLTYGLLILLIGTLCCALIGLIYGIYQTSSEFNLNHYLHWYIPKHLEYPKQFIQAGYMHNAAYLGAAITLPFTWFFHLLYKKHSSKSI